MSDIPPAEQLLMEAEGCFVTIDEILLPKIEKQVRDIRKEVEAGLELLSRLANELRLLREQ